MPAPTLEEQLAAFGPSARQAPPSQAAAETYCRRLAQTHYENFTVATWLLPRHLRQHFCNIYAYCRWADDLADETHDPARSLTLLGWWESELSRCYAGQATHPVFVALRPTIAQFDIPRAPFADLLIAFRRDQTQTSYATYRDLLDYCRFSANPVGRLVLHLGRACNEETALLSDAVCTGLQLANHWQDVARDAARGRIYLPQEDLRRFGVECTLLASGAANSAFQELLAFEVERAEAHLQHGAELLPLLPRDLRLSVNLFVRGGLAILAQIRRSDYDVLRQRPTISKLHKLRLLAAAFLQAAEPPRPMGF